MLDTLNNIDTQIFLYLNGMHSAFWDSVMWWVSVKTNWIPLYVLILGYLVYRWRWKALWILLGTVVLVTLSDQGSVLIKESVRRLRPCHQVELAGIVHLVREYCGGNYGFVSSHAANHFAVAMFTALWIREKWYRVFIMAWAALISYSRIYLGVHFPGDVLGGALLGVLLAWGICRLMILIPAVKMKE